MSRSTLLKGAFTPRQALELTLSLYMNSMRMVTITLNDPLEVVGFPVKTFPMGIAEAFDKLKNILGSNRPYYGLSQMSSTGSLYIAAALKKSVNEKSEFELEEYTIPKGKYAVRMIQDWKKNLSAIPHVFGDLLTDGIDHAVPCVEWYKNDDEMLCMVKLANR